MAEKAFTIKDIASELGVSPTTVHKALYNKKGIGDETKQKILDYVDENNFRLNKAASALKRRPIKLAALLIEPVRSRRFFYADILNGVNDALSDIMPFNVELEKYYSPLNAGAQLEILEKLLEEKGNSIDGLLLVPAHESKLTPVLKRFAEKGVKVVTVNSDTETGSRHACVASDTRMSGRLAGELMCDLGITPNGQVLVIGGNRDMYNHQRTSRGFMTYMQEERPDVDILEIYDGQDAGGTERRLRKFLDLFEDIAGVYCNTSVNTLSMCKTVKDMGLSGKLSVIGSDVFEELMPYFEDKTLTASIYQNPTRQGYKGLQSLFELITGEAQVPERFEISTGIALRGNARSFLGVTGRE